MNKSIFASSLLAIGLAVTGCDGLLCDSGECDTGSSGGGPNSASIDTVGWDCDANAYWYEFFTTGWSSGGWLYINQATQSAWNEEHPVDVYTSDNDGFWSQLYLSLNTTTDYTAQVAGSTTLYSCDNNGMQYTLEWTLVVDDTNGNTETDCVYFGGYPSYAQQGVGQCSEVQAGTATRLN